MLRPNSRHEKQLLWQIIIGGIFTLAFILVGMASCAAHDDDHEHDAWYSELRQPDNPTASCCGLADAYWCDFYRAEGDKAVCTISDDRKIAGRPPIPVGTKIEIPTNKLKWDRGNPTGHSIVFLSSGGAVYCFVQSGGV
jgi:hypothetical protein